MIDLKLVKEIAINLQKSAAERVIKAQQEKAISYDLLAKIDQHVAQEELSPAELEQMRKHKISFEADLVFWEERLFRSLLSINDLAWRTGMDWDGKQLVPVENLYPLFVE
jgi:hypothetical protein